MTYGQAQRLWRVKKTGIPTLENLIDMEDLKLQIPLKMKKKNDRMELYARFNIVAFWGADVSKSHGQDARQIANQVYVSDWIGPRIQQDKVIQSPIPLNGHIQRNLSAHLFSDDVKRDVPIKHPACVL